MAAGSPAITTRHSRRSLPCGYRPERSGNDLHVGKLHREEILFGRMPYSEAAVAGKQLYAFAVAVHADRAAFPRYLRSNSGDGRRPSAPEVIGLPEIIHIFGNTVEVHPSLIIDVFQRGHPCRCGRNHGRRRATLLPDRRCARGCCRRRRAPSCAATPSVPASWPLLATAALFFRFEVFHVRICPAADGHAQEVFHVEVRGVMRHVVAVIFSFAFMD